MQATQKGLNMSKVIDVHSHLLPESYMDIIIEKHVELEDGFALPTWTIEDHINANKECEIDWTLLSISSPHPYFQDDQEAVSLNRDLNRYTATIKDKYPDQYGFCATLPLPNVEASIEEAIYAIDVLGAVGVKIGSNSKGLYLGDPKMDPLFETLDKRNAILIIHPHKPEQMVENVFTQGPIPAYEFLCDTTRAVLNLMANNVPVRYPNIKIVVPHCGSFLPNVADRMAMIQPLLKFQGLLEQDFDVKDNIRRLYFDTAGNPAPHMLELLLTITTPDKIMYGGDFPYTPLALMKKNMDDLNQLFETNETLKPYKEMIMYENARKLFNRP